MPLAASQNHEGHVRRHLYVSDDYPARSNRGALDTQNPTSPGLEKTYSGGVCAGADRTLRTPLGDIHHK